jgi:hypothetical protein
MAREPLSKQRRGTVTSCIMNMIALDYQPFSIVEDAGFKALLEELIPDVFSHIQDFFLADCHEGHLQQVGTRND